MKTRYFSEYDREIKSDKGLNEVISSINENVIENGLKYAVMYEHQLIAEAQETEKEFIINSTKLCYTHRTKRLLRTL